MSGDNRRSFDNASSTSAAAAERFTLGSWDALRSTALPPLFASELDETDALRQEFITGLHAFGMDGLDADLIPGTLFTREGQMTVKPHQLLLVDALNVQHDVFGVEIPRRASKTTTIFTWLLGRCLSRGMYQVTFSAQSGVAGTRRFREWANRLDRINPDVASRGFRILRGAGDQRIEFANGSSFIVLPPKAEAYRGEAADVSWLDEAQELEPEESADIRAAIEPLMDTKPGATLLVSGTTGEARAGLFWDVLEAGRADDPDTGIIDYAVDDRTVEWEQLEDEDTAVRLLHTSHPGLVHGLTNEAKMRKNYRTMGRPQWAREYLSIWPENAGSRLIRADVWETAALPVKQDIPSRVGFAYDISPHGSSAAMVAAWRDADGVAYIELVKHQSGVDWLGAASQGASRAHRSAFIGYDNIGEAMATATELNRLKPKPRLKSVRYSEYQAACSTFLRELNAGTLRHFDQAGLNEAVEVARRVETPESRAWKWGRTDTTRDITPLVAATRALRVYDQYVAGRTSLRPPKAA